MIRFLRFRNFSSPSPSPTASPIIITMEQSFNNRYQSIIQLFKCIVTLQVIFTCVVDKINSNFAHLLIISFLSLLAYISCPHFLYLLQYILGISRNLICREFLFKIYFHWKVRFTKSRTDRKNLHLLVHFQSDHNSFS